MDSEACDDNDLLVNSSINVTDFVGVCRSYPISNHRNSSSINGPNTYDSELKFGFKEMKSPNFWEFKLIWQNSRSDFSMHLIERNQTYQLPEGPCSATSPVANESHLPRGHHIYFSVSNFEFVQTLGGNGLEVAGQ